MPGDMNGVQMAVRAQTLFPDIKLLFASGYASSNITDINLAKDYTILHKPYNPKELFKTLRQILDG